MMKKQIKQQIAWTIAFICILQNAFSQNLNFIYKAGENGYSCFRIPAMVTTTKGTVLAFAEARKNNCGDAGDIDLVVKRSSDNGKTWGALQMIWSDSTNTCGNPAPIVDKRTGNIILLSTWNLGTDHEKAITNQTSRDTRRIFVLSSADDGNTWSQPKEITTEVKPAGWTWYATGPGSGIQIEKGPYKNRLVVACDHSVGGEKGSFSHSVYSDDGGNTWHLGGLTEVGVNESTVAELSKGNLMLNMRNSGPARCRQVSISKDGGRSWSSIYPDSTLIEPVCEGSLISYNYRGKKRCLVFSNPASKTSRSNMTVRLSYNNGKTWPFKKVFYSGPSAYSNVSILSDGQIGCLFEAGYNKPYEGIVFDSATFKEFKKEK
jgi:sialidase-1